MLPAWDELNASKIKMQTFQPAIHIISQNTRQLYMPASAATQAQKCGQQQINCMMRIQGASLVMHDKVTPPFGKLNVTWPSSESNLW